jgi:ABC-type uncharacterized transport system substrate-binding protein
MPVVGFLHSSSPGAFSAQIAAFRQSLKEGGFVEGQNVAIELRSADDRYERLPGLAAELVDLRVAVIFAGGGNISAMAAKAATSTIPIVFPAVADPVRGGLVASLNRPGGNVTGIAALSAELDAKRMEVICELVPRADVIGALLNPNRPNPDVQLKDVQAAAQTVGRRLVRRYGRRGGGGFFGARPPADRGARCDSGPVPDQAARPDRGARLASRSSDHLPLARFRSRRRADQLRHEPGG